MSKQRSNLLVPALVALGAVALMAFLIARLASGAANDDNPAVGFPIVLVGLMVVGSIVAVVWKVVSQRKSRQDS